MIYGLRITEYILIMRNITISKRYSYFFNVCKNIKFYKKQCFSQNFLFFFRWKSFFIENIFLAIFKKHRKKTSDCKMYNLSRVMTSQYFKSVILNFLLIYYLLLGMWWKAGIVWILLVSGLVVVGRWRNTSHVSVAGQWI